MTRTPMTPAATPDYRLRCRHCGGMFVKRRGLYIITLAVRLAGNREDHWNAVEAVLRDRSKPKVSRLKRAESVALAPLDAVQRERVTAAAGVGAAYKLIESYVFRQHHVIGADGELIPCMRKSFFGFSREWRRELAVFDLEPEDVEPQASRSPRRNEHAYTNEDALAGAAAPVRAASLRAEHRDADCDADRHTQAQPRGRLGGRVYVRRGRRLSDATVRSAGRWRHSRGTRRSASVRVERHQV